MNLPLSRKRQLSFLACITIVYILLQIFVCIYGDVELSRGLWLEHRGFKELVDAGIPEKSDWRPVLRIISDHHFWPLRAGLLLTIILSFYYRDKDKKRYIFYKNISLAAIFTLILASGILTWALKIFIGKPRPYTGLTEYIPFMMSNNYHSFPSGHTTETFSYLLPYMYFFKRYSIIILLFTLGFSISFLRVVLSHHYITDVLFGTYAAIFIGNVVCYYFEKKEDKYQAQR